MGDSSFKVMTGAERRGESSSSFTHDINANRTNKKSIIYVSLESHCYIIITEISRLAKTVTIIIAPCDIEINLYYLAQS